MAIEFTKMHGSGNDFVVIDLRAQKMPSLKRRAAQISDRHYGVGCDQIIVIRHSRKANHRMQIYNADGSEVEMCGNGIRCFAKYLWDRNDPIIRANKVINVETPAGIIRPRMIKDNLVQVDMGEPILEGKDIPTSFTGQVLNKQVSIGSKKHRITAVSMGNPHAVIFVKNVDKIDLAADGRLLETAIKIFPNKTNVEFVEVTRRNRLKVRVWERGSGETLACGTGACAVGVAAALNKKTGRKTKIDLPGGTLDIEWTSDNRVLMTGPAAEVFSGCLK